MPSTAKARLDPTLSPDDIRAVVEYAGLAPSVHNTQPWRFVTSGRTLEVYADESRRLDYLDPEGRQLAISCGLVVEYARLAIRGLGRTCVIRLLPSSNPCDPLATLTIGRPEPATADEEQLIAAIALRRTDRGPYDVQAVPPVVLNGLHKLVESCGCWLRVLDRSSDRMVATLLLQRAERMEASDQGYAVELASWSRPSLSPDGIPLAALPAWDAARQVNDMPLRDFTGHNRHPRAGNAEPPPRVERDTLILIGSDTDSRLEWIRTGRSVGLAWLALTAAGLAAQPLGPVTDLATTRAELRRELGLIGYPQLMFRAGYGSATPHTGRRPVSEILETASNT